MDCSILYSHVKEAEKVKNDTNHRHSPLSAKKGILNWILVLGKYDHLTGQATCAECGRRICRPKKTSVYETATSVAMMLVCLLLYAMRHHQVAWALYIAYLLIGRILLRGILLCNCDWEVVAPQTKQEELEGLYRKLDRASKYGVLTWGLLMILLARIIW